MDGIFSKNRPGAMSWIAGIGGILLLVEMVPWYLSREFSGSIVLGVLFSLLGLGLIALAAASFLADRHAFLTLDEEGVCGRYGLRGALACRYADIAVVETGIRQLILQQKDGRRYNILGLENAEELCGELRRRTDGAPWEDAKQLEAEMARLADKRKKLCRKLFLFAVLLFVNIGICVVLTGGRELQDFTGMDKGIGLVFAMLEIGILVWMFWRADQCGKQGTELRLYQARLRRAVLGTVPAPAGNLRAMYMDTEYRRRVSVFGYPHSEEVYFTLEALDPNLQLISKGQSRIYPDWKELATELQSWIAIASEETP